MGAPDDGVPMPHRLSPSLHGARVAKDLLLRVEKVVREAADEGQDADLIRIHALFVETLADASAKRGIQLALIQYVVSAMEGNVIDLRTWQPLSRSDPYEAPPPLVRRL